MLYLTNRQWDNRLKTITTKRLRKFKKALTATSMGHYFNKVIVSPVLSELSSELRRIDI